MSAVCTANRDGEQTRVSSPGVGVWRGGPAVGEVVVGGQQVGVLEILGRSIELFLPANCGGRVVECAAGGARELAVGYGTELLLLDAGAVIGADDEVDEVASEVALAFRAPSAGRFYSRPAPDKPPFVTAGDEIAPGQTVCMLEVMKTFSRITYDGDSARVVRIVPADGDDIEAGDAILELSSI